MSNDVALPLTGVAPDTAARVRALRTRFLAEIAHAFVGSPQSVEMLLVALLARGHVLLEGVPGIAKTTLVKAFAGTLGCTFKRIQFTPDLLPADITGTYVLDVKRNEFVLRRGPVFAQIVLGDEINRAPAKTQSALLEAMQESQVTIEGTTLRLDPPFMVLATQNPVEEEGVYLLPEAQLDRFLFKIVLDYPSAADEARMLDLYGAPVSDVRPLVQPNEILDLSSEAERVHIDEELRDYIVRLARFTREHPKVTLGASPRGSLMLMRAAKACALILGRTFVLPDDVRRLAPAVFGHRLMLTPDAQLDGLTAARVVDEALANVAYSERPLP